MYSYITLYISVETIEMHESSDNNISYVLGKRIFLPFLMAVNSFSIYF